MNGWSPLDLPLLSPFCLPFLHSIFWLSSIHFTSRWKPKFISVQFSCSVVSNSLRPHESQYARPPCPSPTPGVHSNSRPSSQWCHPAISSLVVPFSSCPQSLPASESLPMSQLFAWGSQSTGVSALPSFLPKKSQGWSPSEWEPPIYSWSVRGMWAPELVTGIRSRTVLWDWALNLWGLY